MSRGKVTIYGGSKFDFLYLDRTDSSDQNFFNYKYVPKLNKDTILLCNYDNELKGLGSIKDADGIIFDVYRQKINSAQLEYVFTVPSGALEVRDYDVANQTEYRYYVFPIAEDYNGAPLESNIIKTDWWNWSITGLIQDDSNPDLYYADNDNIWLFDMNLESSEQTQHYAKTVYETLGKYPRVSQGKLNYTSGGITCLISKMENNTLIDTVDMIERWREFCNNTQLKLLKDRKGQMIFIEIMNPSNKLDDISVEQINTITFEYIQIGDTKNISIIGK